MFSQVGGVRGAYGLQIAGVDSPRLQPAAPDWPALTVVREPRLAAEPQPPGAVLRTPVGVRIWIGEGGSIDLERESLTVTIRTGEAVSDDAVLHPYLALPSAFAANWLGRLPLHGGAFLHDGGAWLVLADKQGGKSSTLAALNARGLASLSDDVLVVEDGALFAGPRAVDLRDDAAAVLGGEPLGTVGARERWRLDPGAAPLRSTLRGVIHLTWGESIAVTELAAGDRLPALVGHCVLPPGPDEAMALLDLAALPTVRLERPQRVEALGDCVDQLLAAL